MGPMSKSFLDFFRFSTHAHGAHKIEVDLFEGCGCGRVCLVVCEQWKMCPVSLVRVFRFLPPFDFSAQWASAGVRFGKL